MMGNTREIEVKLKVKYTYTQGKGSYPLSEDLQANTALSMAVAPNFSSIESGVQLDSVTIELADGTELGATPDGQTMGFIL